MHWRSFISELSRRLKAADCFEYADRLDRVLQSLPANPSPKVEAVALKRILGTLVWVRNDHAAVVVEFGPDDPEPSIRQQSQSSDEKEKLIQLCRQAIPLVRHWLRQKASERQKSEEAAEGIKQLLANTTPVLKQKSLGNAGAKGVRKGASRGRRTLAETHPRKWKVYQDIWDALDQFGRSKKALRELKERPEYKQLREEINDLGLTLDTSLIENARRRRPPRKART
jgi:hypothetical protein